MATVAMVIECLTSFSFVPPSLKIFESFSFNERNIPSEVRDTESILEHLLLFNKQLKIT